METIKVREGGIFYWFKVSKSVYSAMKGEGSDGGAMMGGNL